MKIDITIRLTEEQAEFVDIEAKKQRRTKAAVIRNLIDDILQERKLEHSTQPKA